MTTELLRLHAPWVGDQQCSVIGNQSLLQAQCLRSVLILGIEGNKSLGDSLADSVNLGNLTTTAHTDANINAGEGSFAHNEYGFEDLVTEGMGLDKAHWGTIDFNETTALSGVGDSSGSLERPEGLPHNSH